MDTDKDCPGCRGTVWMDEAEIRKIFSEKIAVQKVKLAASDVFQNRLEICNHCSDLDYGTTCRFCGCIVQIKARLAGAYCPHPAGRKW